MSRASSHSRTAGRSLNPGTTATWDLAVAANRAASTQPRLAFADEQTGELDAVNDHAQYARQLVDLVDGALVTESIRQVL